MGINEDYKQMFHSLTVDECREIRDYLTRRIWTLNHLPHPQKTIQEINLSCRARNILRNGHFDTIKDIIDYGLENLWVLRNAGPVSVKEILRAIDRINNTRHADNPAIRLK